MSQLIHMFVSYKFPNLKAKMAKEVNMWTHLNNYFKIQVCLYFHLFPMFGGSMIPSVRRVIAIAVVISQNISNKCCFVCFKSVSSSSQCHFQAVV